MKKNFKIVVEKVSLDSSSDLVYKVVAITGLSKDQLPRKIMQSSCYCCIDDDNGLKIRNGGYYHSLISSGEVFHPKEWEKKKVLLLECKNSMEVIFMKIEAEKASWYGTETIEF